ncbi:MAG: hypothetical protein JXR94_12935, partial [Candidatus Hydrogenedentes bacterium]|nr:hypothetical protein [Candidatus Hydrogenedentota bacterium]
MCARKQIISVCAVSLGCAAASAAGGGPWSYEDWEPGGERVTFDGITFDSTIHCGAGHDFVKVRDGHYRFRSRTGKRLYAWHFYFKIECPEAVGRTITLEVADFNHGGREPWQEQANVYSTDGEIWRAVAPEDVEIVPWTPTGYPEIDEAYGDRGHIPYGVQFRLELSHPVMWFAGPTPYTLERRDVLFKRLAAEHPDCVEVSTVGHSQHSAAHGYPIRMARITAPGDASGRAGVFVMAGEHCAETAGIYACEGWIEEVLAHPDWMDEYVFYFVPIVNVDGVCYGATYYNMGETPGQGPGTNLSRDWAQRTQPETQALWPVLVAAKPAFFASLHNGRHRRSMEMHGAPGPGTDELLRQWRREVGLGIEGCRAHAADKTCWGVLNAEGVTPLAYTIETLLLVKQEGCETFQESYMETGRQLARGTMNALANLKNGPSALQEAEGMPSQSSPSESPVALRFEGDAFTAQLPWFYHGLPFDKVQRHDIFSFEVNGLEIPPGDYTVALAPRCEGDALSVSLDGIDWAGVPIEDGRAELHDVSIRNRMLSFYIKAGGLDGRGPLESVWVYAPDVPFSDARERAAAFEAYRRDIRAADREILAPANWDAFYAVLQRDGFGKAQLRAMFNDIVDWCKRRQVLDPDNIHYGALYSEEDKYDFRDAAAAAVCFTYAWRDTGDEDYRRRAQLARDYCFRGQHMDDSGNRERYGGFCQMVHGAWGKGMQRLDEGLGNATGVETGVITNLVIKTFELGLEPSAADLERVRAAAQWMLNNECSPGTFRHHQGASHDCQNSNAL